MQTTDYRIDDLIFAGARRQVFAIDRYDGRTVWTWQAPQGSGVTSVIVDDDRLIVAAGGYLYCIDPIDGQEVWANPLPNRGRGVTGVTSICGGTDASLAAAEAARVQRNATISGVVTGLGPLLAAII